MNDPAPLPLAAPHVLSERAALVIDTETTGVDPTTARLLQLAVLAYLPSLDRTVEVLSCLVDPGPDVAIPDEAAAVHGITREHLAAGALPVNVAVRQVAHVLATAAAEGRVVVAYNAPYDLGVLDAEAHRVGLAPLADVLVVDPLVLDRHVDRYRRGSRKLAAVAEHYGVELSAAHDAAADARATVHVARRLLDRHPELQGLGADELHKLQADAYGTWQASFNDYLATRGRPPIAGRWPR